MLLLLLFSFFAQAEPLPGVAEGAVANTFSSDSRSPLNHALFPGSTVGKLVGPSGGYCTATLVWRDLIVTAAHCFLDRSGRLQPGTFTFHAGYSRGQSRASSVTLNVWWGTPDAGNPSARDWAIARLEKPLGDSLGWMGIENTTEMDLLTARSYQIGAYSSDYQGGEAAAKQSGCKFVAAREKDIALHNCSTSQGASGAAMFYAAGGKTFIVALNVAEYGDGSGRSLLRIPYSDARANIAIPTKKFYQTLLDAKTRR